MVKNKKTSATLEKTDKKAKKIAEKKLKKLEKKRAKIAKKNSGKTERERVDERREEVLAQGRKFKYPLQYAKHRLVIITIIIAVFAVSLTAVFGWFVLYRAQDTGDMMYRITQVLPLPVANVDGENVRYSDYLMSYRSSLRTVEQQSGKLGNDEAANSVKEQYKRTALNNVEEYTYALKKGKELGITVSNEEIETAFLSHRKVGGVERSEESFLKILNNNFGLDKSEYERMLYLSLMRSKVMAETDTEAKKLAEEVKRGLTENGGDFRAIADTLGEYVQYEETGGLVDMYNIDGGRATEAAKLNNGEFSDYFLSTNGDGYYLVKLVEKTETQVNYLSLKIGFTSFLNEVNKLREENKIKEFIEIKTED